MKMNLDEMAVHGVVPRVRAIRRNLPKMLVAWGLGMLLVSGAAIETAQETHAASETGPIAVLDFVFPGLFPATFVFPDIGAVANQINILDTSPTDEDVSGTLSVFQNHGTPVKADKTLDLRQIRTTAAVLSGVDVRMHRRGASSKMWPKKSYALEFTSAPGSLFGEGKDWVLHACYMDATCMRNVIAYWQASKLFPWAPRTEFAEVFINGYYRGLYVVIEKIKLEPDRVKLPEPTDNAITGGYILERTTKEPDWTSAAGNPWSNVSPKQKALSLTQISYIRQFVDTFERKFDPASGVYDASNYIKYLDEQSAVDYILMQELSRNVDGYVVKSMYITKYPANNKTKYPYDLVPEPGPPTYDGLVHMGPVWDFDLAFGNFQDHGYSVCDANSPTWRIDQHPEIVYQPLLETWKTPSFRKALSARWRTLLNNVTISSGAYASAIKAYAARISDARSRDNRVWKNLDAYTVVNGDPQVPWASSMWECRDYSVPTTFEAEWAKLSKFTRERINWMNARISDPQFLLGK